jgi:hypothetical protein
MFGFLRFLFYTFVAMVVGVFIGTVPVGGHTLADRIASTFKSVSSNTGAKRGRAELQKMVGRSAAHRSGSAVGSTPLAPVSAGTANMPEGHSEDDRAALARVIASRARAR